MCRCAPTIGGGFARGKTRGLDLRRPSACPKGNTAGPRCSLPGRLVQKKGHSVYRVPQEVLHVLLCPYLWRWTRPDENVGMAMKIRLSFYSMRSRRAFIRNTAYGPH